MKTHTTNEDALKSPGRWARVLPRGRDYHVHVMSRVVNREFVLGQKEKYHFRVLMRRLAAFSGLEITTYALMDNHFHLLLKVRQHAPLSEKAFMKRLSFIYDKAELMEVQQRLDRFRDYATDGAYRSERAKYEDRMGDLGQFMKTLKQRYTRWYNRIHGHVGTLWEARYKSVVVEGARDPLLTMATYIDLNAVRAGLVEDPKDYMWCGYGEALGGSKEAQAGLKCIAQAIDRSTQWRMVRRMYRLALYGKGGAAPVNARGEAKGRALSRDRVIKVWEEQGELSRTDLLHCRVRYLTEGVGLGSKAFMEDLFLECRDRFGAKRKTGGRKLRGSGFGELYCFRDFRMRVMT